MQPREDRLAEHPRLRVLVVDVVLALGLVAGELEQPGQRVAQDRAPPVADVQWPRRVHAQELDLKPLAPAEVGRAVARAARGDLGHESLQPGRGQPEVDIPAIGHRLGGRVGDHDRLGQAAGDLLRRPAKLAGQLQAGRARVVAVLGTLGPAQLEVGHLGHAQRARGRVEGRVQPRPDAGDGGGAHPQVGCSPDRVS